MTKAKNTKRALLLSVLSLMLCMAMLVGSTFAWFTDSVTSGKNRITAGNLDVELYHSNSTVTNESVDGVTNLFTDKDGEAVIWEPGVMVYENFKVVNKGSLALKYQMKINVNDYNTVDGKSLKDVLKVAILDEAFSDDRAAAQALTFNKTITDFEKDGKLPAGSEDAESAKEYAVVIYWQPSANDNDYNLNNGKVSSDGNPLFIDLGVSLVATQDAVESDSFDNMYDLDTDTVIGIDDLQTKLATAKEGDTITAALMCDVTIDKKITVPKGVALKLNGNGHTIEAKMSDYAIRIEETTAEISNVTFTGTAKAAILSYANYANPDSQCNITLTNVTVNMESCSQYPLYFYSRGNITMNNCTVTGVGSITNPVGAHIFSGAEINLTVNGGSLGYVVMNANEKSGSKLTLKDGTINKLNFADPNNINGEGRFINFGGTVNEYAEAAETQ